MTAFDTSAPGADEFLAGRSATVATDGAIVLRQPGKRVFDAVVAAVLLTVVAPLMVLIAVAVRCTSRGPVLFGHGRVGRAGRSFRMYKFRSMRVDAEDVLRRDPHLWELYLSNDFKLPPELDPRITRIGRLLRATSLDELPQLLNVVTGDMSLVGPRPVVRAELDQCYGPHRAAYCAVRPGMTGLWQVSGRSSVAFPERARLDARYVDEMSPALDLRILARTVPEVIRRNGAH